MPEQWRTKQPVLCIPGLGLLDEAAALMVAQLIEREGIGARVEQADALSISRIFSLDTKGRRARRACVTWKTQRQPRSGTPCGDCAEKRLTHHPGDDAGRRCHTIEAREALQGFPNTGVVESLDETVAQVRTAASGQQDRAPPPDANALARAASL